MVIARLSAPKYIFCFAFLALLVVFGLYSSAFHNSHLGSFRDSGHWSGLKIVWASALFALMGIFLAFTAAPFVYNLFFSEGRAIWIEGDDLCICAMAWGGPMVGKIALKDISNVLHERIWVAVFLRPDITIYVRNRSSAIYLVSWMLTEPRDVVIERLRKAAGLLPAA